MSQATLMGKNLSAVSELGKLWGTPTPLGTLKEGLRRLYGYDPHGVYHEALVKAGQDLVVNDTLPDFMRTFIRLDS